MLMVVKAVGNGALLSARRSSWSLAVGSHQCKRNLHFVRRTKLFAPHPHPGAPGIVAEKKEKTNKIKVESLSVGLHESDAASSGFA
jgi:hypothetical protein